MHSLVDVSAQMCPYVMCDFLMHCEECWLDALLMPYCGSWVSVGNKRWCLGDSPTPWRSSVNSKIFCEISGLGRALPCLSVVVWYDAVLQDSRCSVVADCIPRELL